MNCKHIHKTSTYQAKEQFSKWVLSVIQVTLHKLYDIRLWRHVSQAYFSFAILLFISTHFKRRNITGSGSHKEVGIDGKLTFCCMYSSKRVRTSARCSVWSCTLSIFVGGRRPFTGWNGSRVVTSHFDALNSRFLLSSSSSAFNYKNKFGWNWYPSFLEQDYVKVL